MAEPTEYAPGWPGITPRWTSSSKSGVGTAFSDTSLVWFTLSHGILNEIYFPRADYACTRDLGLIVTDGRDFFSEEKRHTHHEVCHLAEGIPAYRLTNSCEQGRYRIDKDVVTSPHRDALLQRIRFTPLRGKLEDYHLYALLAPHLGNRGSGNTGWVGDHKGFPMLFAERDGWALALACSQPWLKRSVGFVGFSDGWQDLNHHKRLAWSYSRAENGNVALTGEVDLKACGGSFVLALGFGENPAEAGHHALASLLDHFEEVEAEYVRQWQEGQRTLLPPPPTPHDGRDLYHISCAVLRIHEAKSIPGGIIASLSIPWGFSKGDEDLGGYHLAWPRDLVQTASALVSVGAEGTAHRVLHYLRTAQLPDGHWPQNMWMDDTPYWDGVQMDETAMPILLVELGLRRGSLNDRDVEDLWPMVRRAAGYLVRNGPVTPQDRWETDPGYSPYTLALEVAALLVAAELADRVGEVDTAAYLRETADCWNESIERWTYVTGTELDGHLGIDGHYVRIGTPDFFKMDASRGRFMRDKAGAGGDGQPPASYVVGPDALALVRYGLRRADDPRILNTIKAVDALLKVETPYGPCWRRYPEDRYGEHADGSPFNGSGIGRAWPLLTGERAHYELAAGRPEEATRLMKAMEAFAGVGGLIPEQIWDTQDIPEKDLFCGRPSGSAMPLVWAHAEYLKLRRSLDEGRVFDTPPQTVQRYLVQKVRPAHALWRLNNKRTTIPPGTTLRLDLPAPAVVHWSDDGWRTTHDVQTRDTSLGTHLVDLPTGGLPAGAAVVFTFYWVEAARWEGQDFAVTVGEEESAPGADGRGAQREGMARVRSGK